MTDLSLVQLTDATSPFLDEIVSWNYSWWARPEGKLYAEAEASVLGSLHRGREVPQTYVLLKDGKPAGFFQIADAGKRTYAVNIYIKKEERGKGLGRILMEGIPDAGKKAGRKELYLYTEISGLYEKFGWEYLGTEPSEFAGNRAERLYRKIL